MKLNVKINFNGQIQFSHANANTVHFIHETGIQNFAVTSEKYKDTSISMINYQKNIH